MYLPLHKVADTPFYIQGIMRGGNVISHLTVNQNCSDFLVHKGLRGWFKSILRPGISMVSDLMQMQALSDLSAVSCLSQIRLLMGILGFGPPTEYS